MKYQLAKPFLFLLAVIMVVSLACSLGAPAAEQTPIPQVQQEQPESASAPQPTMPPAPIEPVAQKFYTETFDSDSGLWSYFLVNANESVPMLSDEDFGTMFVGTDGGRLVFDLESERQWAYVTYDGAEYSDVRIDVVAENRGVNNNNVSLICRYTPEEGWYEINIANNGLYWLYHGIIRDDGAVIYTQLADGGSNKIKAGKEINEYTLICKDRTLTVYINGHETRVYEDNNYVLRDGKIGVSVSSFQTLPVSVEFDTITISEP